MERIDTPTKAADLFGSGKHGFKNGNPVTGEPATTLDAAWFNALQEEVANVVEGAGITLDRENRAQLLAAVRSLAAAASTDLVGLEDGADGAVLALSGAGHDTGRATVSGRLGLNDPNDPNFAADLSPTRADQRALRVRGTAGQSAALLEMADYPGNPLSVFDHLGRLGINVVDPSNYGDAVIRQRANGHMSNGLTVMRSDTTGRAQFAQGSDSKTYLTNLEVGDVVIGNAGGALGNFRADGFLDVPGGFSIAGSPLVAASKAASGYLKIGDLYFQWGSITVGPTSSAPFVWPISFPTAIVGVFTQMFTTGAAQVAGHISSPNNYSVHVHNHNASGTYSYYVLGIGF